MVKPTHFALTCILLLSTMGAPNCCADTLYPEAPTYEGFEIATLASERSGPAKLILQNHRGDSSRISLRENSTEELFCEVRASASKRLREEVASKALKLHFGLAATYQVESLLNRTREELDRQLQVQERLIEQGISVPDSLQIERLRHAWVDKLIANDSARKQIRIQLASLIDPQIACNYIPIYVESLDPSDIDVCEYIATAMQCREDLVLLTRLRSQVSEKNLEAWDSLGGFLSGSPVAPTQQPWLVRKLRKTILRGEVDQAIQNRTCWLETLLAERKRQIVAEVEVAYEAKKSAALRWANQRELLHQWDLRIEQLEKLGEALQGNLAAQMEARLNRLSEEGPLIERWLDWQQAQVDLLEAANVALQQP